MLYGYIRDKDIFERDYQLYLSNRLLQALSRSEQAEKRMIGKLKTECGYQWTSKLEGMFKVLLERAPKAHHQHHRVLFQPVHTAAVGVGGLTVQHDS